MSLNQQENKEYILGHSDDELQRLEHQGKFLSGLTRDLLVRTGIVPGMRILDFGSGACDVSIIASELTGPKGEVVAIDRSHEAIEHARFRIRNKNIHNIRLVLGDDSIIPEIAGERAFDALIGRLVLIHQRDPIETFCKLVNYVRPGGVVAFHEVDINGGCWSSQPLSLFERTFTLISQTFMKGGIPSDMGVKLVRAFDKAGMTSRRIVREGLIETGSESEGYEFYRQTVQSLLPLMIKLGLTTEKEVDIGTLSDRLRAEAVDLQAFFIPVYLVGAFGRIKGIT